MELMSSGIRATVRAVRGAVRWSLLLPIRGYRRFLSPLKPYATCRFSPTCSAYAEEALRTHGVFRALALSVWRVLRCQPLCKGGYDPVPLPRNNPPPDPGAREADDR